MNRILFLLLFLPFISFAFECPSQGELESIYLSNKDNGKWIPGTAPIQGAILILHGLNDRPLTMEEMGLKMSENGFHVLLGSLKGHRIPLTDINSIDLKDWEIDINNLVCLLKQKAKGPYYGMGFSLGANLLANYLTYENMDGAISKAVFLAPAFELKWWPNFLMNFSTSLLPRSLKIPSRNLKEYRVHNGLPILVYQQLKKAISKMSWEKLEKTKLPLLLAMDPRDELIDIEHIIQDIEDTHVKNHVAFMPLHSDQKELSHVYRHLIFDSKGLGKKEFDKLILELNSFLKNKEKFKVE